jgi:D-alanyl-D-alanine carboxypeptidase
MTDDGYGRYIADLLVRLGIPADYGRVRGMALQREAGRFLLIARDESGPIFLAPPAAKAWLKLSSAAKSEGIDILPLSGFRSVDRQTKIIRSKLREGQTIPEILKLIAAPGYSEHHTGRAIDLGTPGEPSLQERFELTASFGWLRANAGPFGFSMSYPRGNSKGFVYEPWHWCYNA